MKKLICSACVMIMMSLAPFEVCALEQNIALVATKVQKLTAHLKDPNANVRLNAISGLGIVLQTYPGLAHGIVDKLTPMLKDPNANVQRSAHSILCWIGCWIRSWNSRNGDWTGNADHSDSKSQ